MESPEVSVDPLAAHGTTEQPAQDAAQRPVGPRRRRRALQVLPRGDYVVFLTKDDGSLVPVPDQPGFENLKAAMRWARVEGLAHVKGRRIAVVRFCAVVDVVSVTKELVTFAEKPRSGQDGA